MGTAICRASVKSCYNQFVELLYKVATIFLTTFLGIHLLGGTRAICNTLLSNEEMLNELDRQTGDGDTGATLARGVKGKNVVS